MTDAASPPAATLSRVFVRDLEVHALIGVYDFEKAATQRIRINMDLTVSAPAPSRDSIREVVSYEHLVVAVREMATGQHLHLVETLAERIAALCLADERVVAATVRVEKPDIFADCAAVGVEITRSRQPVLRTS